MKKTITLKKLILGTTLALTLGSTKAQTGAALNLDGADDFVLVPHNAALNVNQFTIETWLKWGASGTPIGFIFSKGSEVMEIHTGGALSNNIRFIPTTGVYIDGGVNTITPGTWVHLACVYNPATALAKMYVNGVSITYSLSGPNTLTTAVVNNTVDAHIGARPIVGLFYNGAVDEFRIWNTARTQCEINTFMNCEIPTTTPNLVLNYHFNQGVAGSANPTFTTVTDFSGTSITGTLISMALTGTVSNWVAPGGVVSGSITPIALPNYTSSSLVICQGNTVSLTGVGATTNTWSGGVSNGVAFTPSATSSYNYTGTNTVTTCSNTAVANVTVNLLPMVMATTNTSLMCIGQTASITASGATSYTWNTGATTTLIAVSPSVNTNYTVSGTAANGCSNMAMITQSVSTCTGINNLSSNISNLSFIVYPNPSNGLYAVTVDSKSAVVVIDMLGKTVYQSTIINSAEINLQHLPNGLYILKAEGNGTIKTIKLIKE